MSGRGQIGGARIAAALVALALSCATAPAPVADPSAIARPALIASSAANAPVATAVTPSATASAYLAPAPSDAPAEQCAQLPPESTAQLTPVPPGSFEELPPNLQLPQDARPTQQAIALNLDPTRPRFSGTTAIGLQFDQPRSVLWLHGRGLHVTEAHLDLQGARLPVDYQQLSEGGLVRARLPCQVQGRALLSISWDAPFNEHLAGLYISREKDIPYIYSQFEAIEARRAFPSFDEPAFKIPFDIELTVPAQDVAVSNGSIIAQSPAEDGARTIRFATTPPLPTYLLAFAVGPFDVVVPAPLAPTAVRDHPLPIRGIAPQGRGPELAFALEATAQLLPRLEAWFGIPFPYEKLDQIAVPDFTHGAMENAGAITYREGDLLYRKETDGERAQEGIASVIAHEMAHQWFGDLVTLRWWTDAWLNESFATWMEAKAVESWRPDLRAAARQQGGVQTAMAADATTTARAIRRPVEEESEIWSQFDGLTYSKGAGLLRMVESFVGPEPFRIGIQRYLLAHKNGSGSSDDLLSALSEAAGRDLRGPMSGFLDAAGVPLVRAKLVCGGKVRVQLEQSRALPPGAQASEAMRAQRWQIPVCLRAGVRGESRSACTLLSDEKGEVELSGTRCPDWVMPNAGGLGYYRFALAPNELQALTAGRAQLGELERASLASNLGAAYVLGTQSASEAIQALSLFAHDREPEVSAALMGVLGDAHENTLESRLRPALEAYARHIYQPLAEKLGWSEQPGEAPAARQERSDVLRFLAYVGRDPAVRKEAARLGRAYANLNGDSFDGSAVSPELAALALSMAVQEGGEEMRQKLVARLVNTDEPAIRARILGALGDQREPAVTPQLLQLTFDPQLHKNERTRLLLTQLTHQETRAATSMWLVAHWDALEAALAPEAMGALVRQLAQLACNRNDLSAAESFLKPRVEKLPAAALDLVQGLEVARLCIARREGQGKSLEAFFSKPSIAR